MADITLYHNSACSKCRAVVGILDESKVSYEVVEYLNSPPSVEQLDAMLTKLKLSPEQIVRTGEDEFQTLGLADNTPKTREEWLKVLHDHPILIERPIVADDTSAVVGRPPVIVKDWLSQRRSNSVR
ncbi:MAG: arsenate reductase (glutaredoxin) [Bdellovibrionales bacterium]|nr:arsenate reductase (glutaredoxin) [Bdellovibrionales bacterium]